ncbi:hypothetical protein DV736_g3262, partial [Chaetothyriales sp. CBS 134916]
MADQSSSTTIPEPDDVPTEPEPEPEPATVPKAATGLQSSVAVPTVNNVLPQDTNLSAAQLDLNGNLGMAPPMDPTVMVNSFPVNGDTTFMAGVLDPMQAGILPMIPAVAPISADEIALYDRQIRLWGVKAQEKIRSANILLIGIKGLGNEIAKNLVLAGVGVLTILDHDPVSADDLGAQFLVTPDKIGQSRAQVAATELQKLNPRVQIFSDTDIVFTKMPEYFSSFDITIATGLPFQALADINMTCRTFNRKFYAADTHGMYGFIFADLGIHEFVIEKEKSNRRTRPGDVETAMRMVISVSERQENGKTIEIVTKQEQYSPLLLVNSSPLPAEATKTMAKKKKVTPLLACLRALLEFQRTNPEGRFPKATDTKDLMVFAQLCNQKQLELDLPRESLRADFLRSFLTNIGSEISPVVAYLGGALAQDVINVLGQREQPLQNFLLFDGENMSAVTYAIHPNLEALGMLDSNGAPMNGTVDGVGADIGMAWTTAAA